MTFCGSYASVVCSATIREASFCHRRKNIQRFTARQCAEWVTMEHTVLNGIYSSNPSCQGSGNFAEEELERS